MKLNHKIAIISMGVWALTACQHLPVNQNIATSIVSENSKQLLSQAIQKSLYQNQDFIAEHQLYLDNQQKSENIQPTTVDSLTLCQTQHDEQFVQQLKADNITSYVNISTLSDKNREVYQQIKQTYLDCVTNAENDAVDVENEPNKNYLVDSSQENDQDDKTSLSPLSNLADIHQIFGLNDEQIKSFNHFVSKSGKIMVTGNYRPMSGYLALQLDAGFENKNLKYHYRVPLVLNWKKQSTYVKPDAIMPIVALYLDNQLGMSWQNKWYAFSQKDKPLSISLTSKYWLMAIKESFSQLPASQFQQISLKDFSPNIAYANQKIAINGTVIQWQQTEKQQHDWHTDVVNRYIQLMDEYFEKQDNVPTEWQEKRQKLSDFVEQQWVSEPIDDNRVTGQISYFVIDNQQLKQIYTTNQAILMGQPFHLRSWITFNPDNKDIHPVNTPNYLQNLVKTLNHQPVIDGFAEVKRIRGLDKSRRLFGEDPEWLTAYEDYQTEQERKKYCQVLKKRLTESNTCPLFNPEKSVENSEQMCENDSDYQEYQDICEN